MKSKPKTKSQVKDQVERPSLAIAVGYIRTFWEEPKRKSALRKERRKLHAYAKKQGIKLAGIFVEPLESCRIFRMENRFAGQRILEGCKNGTINSLLVDSPFDIAEFNQTFMSVAKILLEHKVTLCTLRDGLLPLKEMVNHFRRGGFRLQLDI